MTGPKLRQLRLRMNLTQKVLGEKLRVSSDTVSRWEREVLPITHRTAMAVCRMVEKFDETRRAHLGKIT